MNPETYCQGKIDILTKVDAQGKAKRQFPGRLLDHIYFRKWLDYQG